MLLFACCNTTTCSFPVYILTACNPLNKPSQQVHVFHTRIVLAYVCCKCVSKNSSSYIVIVVSPHGQSSAEKTLMSVIQILLFYSDTNSKHTFSGVLEITNFGPRQKVAMVS